MFCLSEIALAFHHLLCRDEVHMKSQWLWIHLLLLFSTDNWLEQWNVCVCSLWNCTPCLFSGGLALLSPLLFFFFPFFCLFYFGFFFLFHFSLMLITSWACMKMTSLTLCISMCHSPSKACLPIFLRVLCLCCVSAEQAYSRKTGRTRVHRYLTWNVVFISLSLLKY